MGGQTEGRQQQREGSPCVPCLRSGCGTNADEAVPGRSISVGPGLRSDGASTVERSASPGRRSLGHRYDDPFARSASTPGVERADDVADPPTMSAVGEYAKRVRGRGGAGWGGKRAQRRGVRREGADVREPNDVARGRMASAPAVAASATGSLSEVLSVRACALLAAPAAAAAVGALRIAGAGGLAADCPARPGDMVGGDRYAFELVAVASGLLAVTTTCGGVGGLNVARAWAGDSAAAAGTARVGGPGSANG